MATDLAKIAKETFSGYDVDLIFPLSNQVNVYVYCDIKKVTIDDIIRVGSNYISDDFKIEILIPETILNKSGQQEKNTKRVDISLIYSAAF